MRDRCYASDCRKGSRARRRATDLGESLPCTRPKVGIDKHELRTDIVSMPNSGVGSAVCGHAPFIGSPPRTLNWATAPIINSEPDVSADDTTS
jgi:hypothetical protein